MQVERYARGLVPSNPQSLPNALDNEFLKLERFTDAIRTAALALTASEIANVPAGTIAATNVQAAIAELAGDTTALTTTVGGKADLAGATFTGPVTVPSPFTVGSSQVLTTRRTGWAADTGTAKRTANATYTAATISNPPTQAEVQAIANALQDVSQALKALKDDLLTHGLIGT